MSKLGEWLDEHQMKVVAGLGVAFWSGFALYQPAYKKAGHWHNGGLLTAHPDYANSYMILGIVACMAITALTLWWMGDDDTRMKRLENSLANYALVPIMMLGMFGFVFSMFVLLRAGYVVTLYFCLFVLAPYLGLRWLVGKLKS